MSKSTLSKSTVFIAEGPEIRKESSQATGKEDKILEQGLISRKTEIDVNVLRELYKSNTSFFSVVKQIATDVVAGGFELNLRRGKRENAKEKDRIEGLIDNPNDLHSETLEDIVRAIVIDWAVFGPFCLERVPTRDGSKTAEIYRVGSDTIKVHKSWQKYRQERNNKKVWFKAFGSDEVVWQIGNEKRNGSEDKPATELLYCRGHSIDDDYYGDPNILPAIGQALTFQSIRDWNLSMFENNGVPSYMITLTGPWEEGSDQKIAEFLRTHCKGSSKSHKNLILQCADGCDAKFETVSKINSDKELFQAYSLYLQKQIQMVYSMPGYRIGIIEGGPLGGEIVQETGEIYADNVVNPLKRKIGIMLTKLIASPNYIISLAHFDPRIEAVQMETYAKAGRLGAVRGEEIRDILHLPPDEQAKHLQEYFAFKSFLPVEYAMKEARNA